ncbi:acyltransferase [Mucilaginibacter sabulilitoris]|uniref:Acyltransferase n=1 Tax=Mucilaginibacter sabulilitoris TaxID=1173583 RepID=A0ABZ0TGT6_9SPHI|nr:acyltransferase [Mucilaginibacter sabulilitoris]WPU91627.1 acyltransferase [Mucilaginibacter sabulilitoris]
MKKLPYINALRGIAILIIVISHTQNHGTGLFKMHPYLLPLLDEGNLGVQWFFILSAFTLFRSYHLRSHTDVKPIKSFFIRRIFRIAPLFYWAIIYYLWQNAVLPGQTFPVTTAHIIASILFINSFWPNWATSVGPGGWTVGVEMVFYALLPLLFKYIKNTKVAFNFLLLALLFRIIVLYLLQTHPLTSNPTMWYSFLFFSFPNQLFVFALGVVMYFIIVDNYQAKVSPKSLMTFTALLTLEAVYNNQIFLSKLFMASCGLFFFCLALSRYQPKIFVNVFLNYWGKISYVKNYTNRP